MRRKTGWKPIGIEAPWSGSKTSTTSHPKAAENAAKPPAPVHIRARDSDPPGSRLLTIQPANRANTPSAHAAPAIAASHGGGTQPVMKDASICPSLAICRATATTVAAPAEAAMIRSVSDPIDGPATRLTLSSVRGCGAANRGAPGGEVRHRCKTPQPWLERRWCWLRLVGVESAPGGTNVVVNVHSDPLSRFG